MGAMDLHQVSMQVCSMHSLHCTVLVFAALILGKQQVFGLDAYECIILTK